MKEKSDLFFRKFSGNIWVRRLIWLFLSITALFIISLIVNLANTYDTIKYILAFLGVLYIIYDIISHRFPMSKEKEAKSTSTIYSYHREPSPLEKKYQEIDRQLDIWEKDFEDYYNLMAEPDYEEKMDSEILTHVTNSFKETSAKVFRLAETYKKHQRLIDFAYKIAIYKGDEPNANIYKGLLVEIDREEWAKLQDKDYIQAEQKKSLSTEYYNKSQALKKETRIYIGGFIGVSVVFLLLLGYLYVCYPLPSENDLIAFLIIKTTLSITFAMVVFWLARFCNRRVHENVHLIEEYSHRSLLLNTFDLLTNSVNDENHKREILDKVLTSLIQNPTECLNRKKADKIPNDFIKLLGSISSMKPEIIIKNEHDSKVE